ncbi:MAG: FAD-binding protein [Candidatus Omnitrophica bacterium]|nr:FAD-binding protein [Candidatus Omnitrophota bacterium]
MKKIRLKLQNGIGFDCYCCDTLVVGSGAAGLNCALYLAEAGREVMIVTSNLLGGTSYNSGSDKQTYYKLSVFGQNEDSPLSMAQALFEGGAMDGDLAYIESLGSLPSFFRLVEKGVPFPANEFGAFVGYKTDHDPRQRATSAGPKTSRYMVECLLKAVKRLKGPIFDGLTVVNIVTRGKKNKAIVGVVAIDRRRLARRNLGTTVFWANAVVLATGGPGELYAANVYPEGQVSLHGVALEAGVKAVNLGEAQFGLSSLGFRWNLSGTYQQVIPSYVSLDQFGKPFNFLENWYRSWQEMTANIFLKGYQWPFSAERLENFGSSLVDLAVFQEKNSGRRVFLDFSQNPEYQGKKFNFGQLSLEARTYLQRSGAFQRTPYQRLQQMNPEAIEIFGQHGIDLKKPVEVAICFQHNNGGLAVDTNWQTNIAGLFAIGELAGTHGVKRPGGAALNSGQVGGWRVAKYLYQKKLLSEKPGEKLLLSRAAEAVLKESQRMLSSSGKKHSLVRQEVQKRMMLAAGFIRYPSLVAAATGEARKLVKLVKEVSLSTAREQLVKAWETRNLVIAHQAFLSEMVAGVAVGM